MYILKSLLRTVCALLLGVCCFSITSATGAPAELDETHAAVQAVMAVQNEVTAEWLKIPEILGTAVGLDKAGSPALVVYLDRESTRMADVVRSLPPSLRGIGVQVEATDKFRAFPRGGHGRPP